jgi:hypothetical protein
MNQIIEFTFIYISRLYIVHCICLPYRRSILISNDHLILSYRCLFAFANRRGVIPGHFQGSLSVPFCCFDHQPTRRGAHAFYSYFSLFAVCDLMVDGGSV